MSWCYTNIPRDILGFRNTKMLHQMPAVETINLDFKCVIKLHDCPYSIEITFLTKHTWLNTKLKYAAVELHSFKI